MNRAILNNVDHHDLRVIRRHGAQFGDSVNQVLIFPTEFEEIQREYPILFRKGEDSAFQAVAILGLDRDENLFLGEDGGWHARYVPAVQLRGPFSIALTQPAGMGADEPEPMIHVDLDDPRVGRAEGEPLFMPQGGNAPYLDHIARVLRGIHIGLEQSGRLYAAFEELGLLEPVLLEISLSDTETYKLPNHYTIGADRFAQLEGSALERLNKAGFLKTAVFAMASLANFSRLVELKSRKRLASGG